MRAFLVFFTTTMLCQQLQTVLDDRNTIEMRIVYLKYALIHNTFFEIFYYSMDPSRTISWSDIDIRTVITFSTNSS